MREKIYISEDFFNSSGEMLFQGRNQVRMIKHEGLDFVVKSFKRANLFNRLVYTYLRKSKAERSFCNSKHLIDNGFIIKQKLNSLLKK